MKRYSILVLTIVLCITPGFSQNTGTITDVRDGKTYKTVKIGDQWWMAENLAYLPYVSKEEDRTGIWVYGFNKKNIQKAKESPNYNLYGCLYDWKSANLFCPDGWHLPSNEDWNVLKEYLESSDYVGAGSKLKAKFGWENNMGNTNGSGFSAIPGGKHEVMMFISINRYAYFWTSSEYNTNPSLINKVANYRSLLLLSSSLSGSFTLKESGLSVRCIKD